MNCFFCLRSSQRALLILIFYLHNIWKSYLFQPITKWKKPPHFMERYISQVCSSLKIWLQGKASKSGTFMMRWTDGDIHFPCKYFGNCSTGSHIKMIYSYSSNGARTQGPDLHSKSFTCTPSTLIDRPFTAGKLVDSGKKEPANNSRQQATLLTHSQSSSWLQSLFNTKESGQLLFFSPNKGWTNQWLISKRNNARFRAAWTLRAQTWKLAVDIGQR